MKTAHDSEAAPIADSVPAICAVVGADPIETAAAPADARPQTSRQRFALAAETVPVRLAG